MHVKSSDSQLGQVGGESEDSRGATRTSRHITFTICLIGSSGECGVSSI